jgi:hypothetical protein
MLMTTLTVVEILVKALSATIELRHLWLWWRDRQGRRK